MEPTTEIMSCDSEDWPDKVKKTVREATRIKSAKVTNMFNDDHCPCFEIDMMFANRNKRGKMVKFGFWWRSPSGVLVCTQSEVSSKARQTLLNELKKTLNDIKG